MNYDQAISMTPIYVQLLVGALLVIVGTTGPKWITPAVCQWIENSSTTSYDFVETPSKTIVCPNCEYVFEETSQISE